MSVLALETTTSSREPLRPGGFDLTIRALEFCNPAPGSQILDIGCGSGASLAILTKNGFDPHGLDISRFQVEQSRGSCRNLLQSDGRSIPFHDAFFDLVLLECTLSVIENPEIVLSEIHRVLKPDGRLIFSDIYARNAISIDPLKASMSESAIRSIWSEAEIENLMINHSLKILLKEDCSHFLRKNMISQQDQVSNSKYYGIYCFQPRASVDALGFFLLLSKARMGYLLLIARKTV